MFDDFEDNGGEEEDSSDAEYADIDATADDNVFGGTQKDKTSVSEKNRSFFSSIARKRIDCRFRKTTSITATMQTMKTPKKANKRRNRVITSKSR